MINWIRRCDKLSIYKSYQNVFSDIQNVDFNQIYKCNSNKKENIIIRRNITRKPVYIIRMKDL